VLASIVLLVAAAVLAEYLWGISIGSIRVWLLTRSLLNWEEWRRKAAGDRNAQAGHLYALEFSLGVATLDEKHPESLERW